MEKKNGQYTRQEIEAQGEALAAVGACLPAIRETLAAVFAEDYELYLFTGCGTSLYLAQSAAHIFSQLTGLPAQAVCCSELYYSPECYIAARKTLVMPITRKSSTTEVRMAIERVRSLPGVKTLAITCDADSRLYNDAYVLSPRAEEKSVVMTGSFTSMLYLAAVCACVKAGKQALVPEAGVYAALTQRILEATRALAEKNVAEAPDAGLFIMLGQGAYYGVANECMNKMKEMGLVNSEAYYSLEYRHGPMSLVDEKTCIILLTDAESLSEDERLLTQMHSLGARTVVIGEMLGKAFADADERLELGTGLHPAFIAPLMTFIGQWMGYYLAERKGLDADAPRHLSQVIVIDTAG